MASGIKFFKAIISAVVRSLWFLKYVALVSAVRHTIKGCFILPSWSKYCFSSPNFASGTGVLGIHAIGSRQLYTYNNSPFQYFFSSFIGTWKGMKTALESGRVSLQTIVASVMSMKLKSGKPKPKATLHVSGLTRVITPSIFSSLKRLYSLSSRLIPSLSF
ncbi:hypothetical protein ES703_100719 [subsurface metagenome]